ncbi:MAG: DUF2505 domain-containing protein [Myxococcales bacterium]|nr:DUF2505 domain-containing protein [Myxococcales bacterium]
MKQVKLVHEINCSPEVFWKLQFDPVFNEALLGHAMKIENYKVLKFEENDREIRRTTTGQPKIDLPGPIKKIMGSGFAYTEEGRLDKAAQKWHWKIQISTFGDKVRNEGTLRLEKIGDNKIRRIAESEIEAKIFGVGGLIEGNMEKAMIDGWTAGAAFINKWIADGKAG